MAPLCDVLSYYLRRRRQSSSGHRAGLAMAVRSKNAHHLFHTIQARHWRQLADQAGRGTSMGSDDQKLVAASTAPLARLERRLPKDPRPHLGGISAGMRGAGQRASWPKK